MLHNTTGMTLLKVQHYVYAYIAYLVDSINYKFPHYVPVGCNTDKWYK
jgi:hypothetical protein